MKKNTNGLRLGLAEYFPELCQFPNPNWGKVIAIAMLLLVLSLRVLGQGGNTRMTVPDTSVALTWSTETVNGTTRYVVRASWMPSMPLAISGLQGAIALKTPSQLRFATSAWRSSLDTVAGDVRRSAFDSFGYRATFSCRSVHPLKSQNPVWVEWVFTLENGQTLGDIATTLDGGIILVDLIEGYQKSPWPQPISPVQARIFPNPASDLLQVELPESEHVNRLIVIDMHGAVLLGQACKSAHVVLDIQGLLPGGYVLLCYQDEHILHRFRFTKI